MTGSHNDQINLWVCVGLMVIDAVLWIGIIYLHTRGPVDNAMVLAAGSIPAGLIGFITRTEPKHTQVDAGPQGQVTVNPPADEGDETP